MTSRSRSFRLSWAGLLLLAGPGLAQSTEVGQWIAKPAPLLTNTQQFGRCVAADGEYFVVGTAEAEAEVFRWVGGTWVPWQTLDAASVGGSLHASFGNGPRSIRLRGDELVIGADGADNPSGAHGAVYVFKLNQQNLWSLDQTLLPFPNNLIDAFGFSVDFNERWLAVGSFLSALPNTNNAAEGAVFLYERNAGAWEVADPDTLGHPDLFGASGVLGRQFGSSVALQGDRLFVGAPHDHVPGSFPPVIAGSVVEFDLSAADPQASGSVVRAPLPAHQGYFGLAIAASPTTLVLGEPGRPPSGQVYRADLSQGGPVVLEPIASPAPAGSGFGFSLAVRAHRVLVGAAGLVSTAWELRQTSAGIASTELVRSFSQGSNNDHLGFSAAITEHGLVIGAPGSLPPPPLSSPGCVGLAWFYPREGPFEAYCTAGASASGCEASIAASGTPSATAPSGFALSATSVEGKKDGVFFFGVNGRQANPWGNGTSYQCVAPPVKRAGVMDGNGTLNLCDATFSKDLNSHWNLKPSHNPGPGSFVQAQLWYRDPQNTSNQTTSLSDALEFLVGP